MSDLVERLRDADTTRRIGESYADTHERRQRDREEAATRIAQLEAALNNIGMYTYPRVPGEYADECTHEIIIGKQLGLNHECHDCMAAYARAALEERT